MLNGMKWSGSEDWFTAPRGLWINPKSTSNMPAGYGKSLKGLDFVVVYNSGHLVPYNQPENALDLITRFIQNKGFSDYPLPSFDFYNKTINPGTSLANGMYPLEEVSKSSERVSHHTQIVILVVIVSFAVGAFVGSYFSGRRGYEKI